MLVLQYQVHLPFLSGKISILAFSIELIKQPLIFVPQNHQKIHFSRTFNTQIRFI